MRVLHIFFACMYLFGGAACEKEDHTRSLDRNYDTEIIKDGPDISLTMENDRLEDDVEEIHFYSKEYH